MLLRVLVENRLIRTGGLNGCSTNFPIETNTHITKSRVSIFTIPSPQVPNALDLQAKSHRIFLVTRCTIVRVMRKTTGSLRYPKKFMCSFQSHEKKGIAEFFCALWRKLHLHESQNIYRKPQSNVKIAIELSFSFKVITLTNILQRNRQKDLSFPWFLTHCDFKEIV